MPDRARDHIDDLVDWQIDTGRARGNHYPPRHQPTRPHRPGLLGLIRDAITAVAGRR